LIGQDQCEQANVPFFFKQWGEYLIGEGSPCDHVIHWQNGTKEFYLNRTHLNYNAWLKKKADNPLVLAHRVGKKLAGRSLDGVEHNAMPEVK
jgi:hypothetical protein